MGVPATHTQNQRAADIRGITEPRLQLIRAVVSFVASMVGISIITLFALSTKGLAWQQFVLLPFPAAVVTYTVIKWKDLYNQEKVKWAVGIFSGLFGLTLIAYSLLIESTSILASIVVIVFSLILSAAFPDSKTANTSLTNGIIVATLCALLPEISHLWFPIEQISNPIILVSTPALLGILAMTYIVLLVMQVVTATLRIRLVSAILIIVIIPLAGLAVVQTNFTFEVLHEQTNQSLLMAAQETAKRVDRFIIQNRNALVKASHFEVLSQYLQLSPEERQDSQLAHEVRAILNTIDIDEIDSSHYMNSYALLDSEGRNLFDTYSAKIGRAPVVADPITKGQGTTEYDADYFQIPMNTGVEYISPVQLESSSKAYFYISAPVKDKSGKSVGVLRARFDALIFHQIISEHGGRVQPNSYAILLDDYNIRLADGFTPNFLYRALAPLSNSTYQILKQSRRVPDLPASMVATNLVDFDQTLQNLDGNPFFSININISNLVEEDELPEIGAVTSLEAAPWKVVYLIENFDDPKAHEEQQALVTIITALVAGVVGIIAVGVSEVLSNPITQLIETSNQISQGNLNARAPGRANDEFGLLGSSFNMMTEQLQTLISELEERVKARTQEIENQNEALTTRTRQLQTLSDVARQIVSVQDLESLLPAVTRLISERFDFYHVGVFLLDEAKEFAILRAANSEGGQRMLARNHMLPVGKVGIVGYVTAMGQPRIATDVGGDAIYFNNPDLPLTRSEMALPLKVGNQIIGALDIQSTQSNAFHPDDIELFNALADQVAIAIYNNQLFAETVRALNEAQTLHRQYLQEAWDKELESRKIHGYIYNRMGMVEQRAEPPEWKQVIETGQPVVQVERDVNGVQDRATIAMPITVRGETIGVIHVQDSGIDRYWSDDELAVVNDVAGQVAVALENARLFEATARRADREKKVLEITQRIRSTNEPDRMMQIAVNELQRALGVTRTQIYVRRQSEEPEA